MTDHAVGDPGLDFTSSSFLGLRYGTGTLPSFTTLTTGVPAVLHEPAAAHRIAATVAAAQGAQAGVVGRSALHALMDVMGMLPHRGDVVAIDAAAYPLAWWAALRAAANGAVVRKYPHHRPEFAAESGRRLFLLTDGWCPGCNQPAPLRELQRAAVEAGGTLVVDDSLAFGVLGRRRRGDAFGEGSGTPTWRGLDHQAILWVASLAKACGAPLAVTTGDRATIRRLARTGGNRVHSSPPSSADLGAATMALYGDHRARRSQLQSNVLRLRNRLRDLGLPVNGLPFPVVSIRVPDAYEWWSELRSAGIRAVLQQSRCRPGVMLSVLVRADHSPADLDRLTAALRAVRRGAA
ncbi:aminotransferase class I/II-fold pyridoxal phosphate-dependent enzyme [Kribbella sp. CA-247076]|uniref:aminotransferase class I/II-fold pyridoxal phosphate-dependent enzyme n=1 Tax=Kribbella sp. CA-247076 TaxID=3239941 RepID=UPI003D9235BC